jgi:hypothetical protein
MGNIDYERNYSHDELSAAWKNNIHKIEGLTHEEKRERYFGMDTGFKSIDSMNYLNALNTRYNEEKQTIVCQFEYLPGVEYGTIYEIRNVTDETHAFRVLLTFLTMLFIELSKAIPKTTVEAMIKQNKEAIEWASNYSVRSEEQKQVISSDAEQNGITLGTNV